MEAQKKDIREYLYNQGGVCREVLSEREIAEHFAIKRNHARELLLELIGEGVVERRPRSGYSYVDYHSTAPDGAMVLRYLVELEAAAAAVRCADREDEVRLTLACEALRRAADRKDLSAFAAADREFHTVLVRASHDNMLIRIFDFLLATIFRQPECRAAFSELHRTTQRHHEEILQAFLARDGAVLQDRLKPHLGLPRLRDHLDRLVAPPRRRGNRGAGPEC